jgi:hypothetical protein
MDRTCMRHYPHLTNDKGECSQCPDERRAQAVMAEELRVMIELMAQWKAIGGTRYRYMPRKHPDMLTEGQIIERANRPQS